MDRFIIRILLALAAVCAICCILSGVTACGRDMILECCAAGPWQAESLPLLACRRAGGLGDPAAGPCSGYGLRGYNSSLSIFTP